MARIRFVHVNIEGCDDTTSFNIEADNIELAFLKKLCALSEETSTYGCMPVMKVYELDDKKDGKS